MKPSDLFSFLFKFKFFKITSSMPLLLQGGGKQPSPVFKLKHCEHSV